MIHEKHAVLESDDNFEVGTLAHIIVGNEGRLLDSRRTCGYIESYDSDSAMFIWRITSFEDTGNCWEMNAENINSFQIRKGSPILPNLEVEKINI